MTSLQMQEAFFHYNMNFHIHYILLSICVENVPYYLTKYDVFIPSDTKQIGIVENPGYKM